MLARLPFALIKAELFTNRMWLQVPFATLSAAVYVNLANCEPKSCALEFNYVVRLPIQPVKKLYLHAQLFGSHFARSTQTAVVETHNRYLNCT